MSSGHGRVIGLTAHVAAYIRHAQDQATQYMEEEGAHEPPTPEELLTGDGQKGESGFFSDVAHGRLSILQRTVPYTPAHKGNNIGLSVEENQRRKSRSWKVDGGESQGGDEAELRMALNLLYPCMKLPKSK